MSNARTDPDVPHKLIRSDDYLEQVTKHFTGRDQGNEGSRQENAA